MGGGRWGWLFADGKSWDEEEEGEINSVGDYIGDSDGNIDTSPYGSAISNPSVSSSVIQTANRSHHCTGTVRAVVLNPSVIPSEKNNPPKPPRQRHAFFLNSKTFPSVITD